MLSGHSLQWSKLIITLRSAYMGFGYMVFRQHFGHMVFGNQLSVIWNFAYLVFLLIWLIFAGQSRGPYFRNAVFLLIYIKCPLNFVKQIDWTVFIQNPTFESHDLNIFPALSLMQFLL